jgi:hypothetical protein
MPVPKFVSMLFYFWLDIASDDFSEDIGEKIESDNKNDLLYL